MKRWFSPHDEVRFLKDAYKTLAGVTEKQAEQIGLLIDAVSRLQEEAKPSTEVASNDTVDTAKTDKLTYFCSFCGKSQHDVRKLIAGPKGVFICDEDALLCIEICMDPKEMRGAKT